MSISVEVELDDKQLKQVAAIFGTDVAGFSDRLEQLAAAGVEEYVTAFSGFRSPTGIVEFRENRLNLLYKHLPDPEPTDRQVERLFQRSPAQARTLVAGVRARYESEIGERLNEALVAALKTARATEEKLLHVVVPDSLGAYLKDLAAQTSAPPVEKRRDVGRTYDVTRETVAAISPLLGIDKTEIAQLDWSKKA